VESVFVPITVGGGIASIQDARRLFNAGADKVAVNTAALKRPALINEMAGHFGSQAVVVSIEAKRTTDGWEAYSSFGRDKSGVGVVEWAMESVKRGAGELLLSSVDRDGTRRGFDTELVAAIAPHVTVPVTASGGLWSLEHLKAVLHAGADAVAVGSALHYGKVTFEEMRAAAVEIRSLRHPFTLLERPSPGVAKVSSPE
jgi:cyclase